MRIEKLQDADKTVVITLRNNEYSVECWQDKQRSVEIYPNEADARAAAQLFIDGEPQLDQIVETIDSGYVELTPASGLGD
jgi:hypothetical protein